MPREPRQPGYDAPAEPLKGLPLHSTPDAPDGFYPVSTDGFKTADSF